MSGHTPLPWTTKWECHVFSGERLIANTGGYSSNVESSRVREENNANAEFIVRACNSYSDLLTAAKLFATVSNQERWTNDDWWRWAVSELSAAIAKAEGHE